VLPPLFSIFFNNIQRSIPQLFRCCEPELHCELNEKGVSSTSRNDFFPAALRYRNNPSRVPWSVVDHSEGVMAAGVEGFCFMFQGLQEHHQAECC
jgi:hypothetical protein